MKHLILILFTVSWISVFAADPTYHCEKDIVEVNDLIEKIKGQDASTGDRLIMVAESFLGAPEDDYYTTDSVASLRINVDSFTPLMFINHVVAIVKAAENRSIYDETTFYDQLVGISCRRGENNGFPSIMYHTSDWIGDNISRGNITELTEDYAGAVARTKSLDEMTRKRGSFAALADSATFETVRMTEMGFRTHRVASLKKETIKKKELIDDLQNGDIIILVPNRDGIDMYDIGFVVKENGTPYFIHVSPQTHQVVKEKDDLIRYMNTMTKHFQGYRILRLRE